MKFSILVPAYKPQFLAECIESILAQTYPDWELILVNDASPYDIDSIVQQYNDRRIRYRKRDKGYGAERLVDNWNDCLNDASGDYVINMGDDDKLQPNCLADYVALVHKYPGKDIYHVRAEIINEHSETVDIQEIRPEVESVYSMIWGFWNGRKQWMGDWLFKTESLRRRGGFYLLPCAWGSDHISAFIAAIENGVANCARLGFSYRASTSTISRSKLVTPQKILAWNQANNWYKNFLNYTPTNEDDKMFWQYLVNRRKSYIDHFKAEEIVQNITFDFRNICFWFLHRKRFQISWKLLFQSIVQLIKNQILNLANTKKS